MVLIEREGVLEDTEKIEELKPSGVAVSIKESELVRIDMQAINDLVAEDIDRENLGKFQNAVEKVVLVMMPDNHTKSVPLAN